MTDWLDPFKITPYIGSRLRLPALPAPPPGLPPVRIESWLARSPEISRERQLKNYLTTVTEKERPKELKQLLALARSADPAPLRHYSYEIVERRLRIELETPLFEFSAPDIDGAKVSVQTFSNQTLSLNWQVVFGAGGGPTKTFTVSERNTYTAAPGQCQLPYLPVPAMAVRRYKVTWSRLISVPPGFVPTKKYGCDSIRPTNYSRSGIYAVAAKTLFWPSSPKFPLLLSERLSGTPTSGVARASSIWGEPVTTMKIYLGKKRARTSEHELPLEWSRQFSLSSGGTFLGMSVSAGASITLSGGFILKMTLPPGHDYYLQSFVKRPGIRWLVDPLS